MIRRQIDCCECYLGGPIQLSRAVRVAVQHGRVSTATFGGGGGNGHMSDWFQAFCACARRNATFSASSELFTAPL